MKNINLPTLADAIANRDISAIFVLGMAVALLTEIDADEIKARFGTYGLEVVRQFQV